MFSSEQRGEIVKFSFNEHPAATARFWIGYFLLMLCLALYTPPAFAESAVEPTDTAEQLSHELLLIADYELANTKLKDLEAQIRLFEEQQTGLRQSERASAEAYEQAEGVVESLLERMSISVNGEAMLDDFRQAEREVAEIEKEWWSLKEQLAKTELALAWRQKAATHARELIEVMRPTAEVARAKAIKRAAIETSEMRARLEQQRQARRAALEENMDAAVAREEARLQTKYDSGATDDAMVGWGEREAKHQESLARRQAQEQEERDRNAARQVKVELLRKQLQDAAAERVRQQKILATAAAARKRLHEADKALEKAEQARNAAPVDDRETRQMLEKQRQEYQDAVVARSESALDAEAIWMTARKDNDLLVSGGIGYRIFSDIDFAGTDFRNFGTQDNGTFVFNQMSPDLTNGPYGVQNVQSPVNALVQVPAEDGGVPDPIFEGQTFIDNDDFSDDIFMPIDYINYPGNDDNEVGGTPGLNLQVARPMWYRDDWTVSFVTGLQSYSPRDSTIESGSMVTPGKFIAEQYLHTIVDTDDDAFGTIHAVVNPASELMDPTVDNTTFSMRNEFDLQFMTFDLGLRASYRSNRMTLDVAAGPTLSVWHLDSDQSWRAVWGDIASSNLIIAPGPPPVEHYRTAPVVIPAGEYRESRSDSSSGVTVGTYISGGMSYDLTPRLGVATNLRYDLVGETASTDFATLNLDGLVLQILLNCRF
jgi:hypothetical protein